MQARLLGPNAGVSLVEGSAERLLLEGGRARGVVLDCGTGKIELFWKLNC